MANEQITQQLEDMQTKAAETVAYQASLASVMSAMGARMPGLQRLARIMLEEAVDNEARVTNAVRMLGSGSPFALQQACAALQGLPSSAVNPRTGELASLH